MWRTASFHRARELLVEAREASLNHDSVRVAAVMERLYALPGFPRGMGTWDRLRIEEIPPIISLGA